MRLWLVVGCLLLAGCAGPHTAGGLWAQQNLEQELATFRQSDAQRADTARAYEVGLADATLAADRARLRRGLEDCPGEAREPLALSTADRVRDGVRLRVQGDAARLSGVAQVALADWWLRRGRASGMAQYCDLARAALTGVSANSTIVSANTDRHQAAPSTAAGVLGAGAGAGASEATPPPGAPAPRAAAAPRAIDALTANITNVSANIGRANVTGRVSANNSRADVTGNVSANSGQGDVTGGAGSAHLLAGLGSATVARAGRPARDPLPPATEPLTALSLYASGWTDTITADAPLPHYLAAIYGGALLGSSPPDLAGRAPAQLVDELAPDTPQWEPDALYAALSTP